MAYIVYVNDPNLKDEGDTFGERVKALKQHHEHRIGHLMDKFAEKRNAVEYDGYEVYDKEWEELKLDYAEIMKWASAPDGGYDKGLPLEPVE